MGVEKDFIKREVERLNLLLTGLLDKSKDEKPKDFKNTIDEINEALKENFNFSLQEISEISNDDLIDKLSKHNEVHLEKLAKLLYTIIQNADFETLNQDFDKNSISKKAIVLINYIDSISTTFSLKRMQIKNRLKAL